LDDAGDAVVAAAGRTVEAWSVPGGRLLGRFGVSTAVVRIALAPDRDVVATGDELGVVRLWSIGGQRSHVLRLHHAAVTDLRFARDGRRLVTASQGSADNAAIWDVATGRLLSPLVGHFGTVSAASFSPDDRWVATAGPVSAAIWSAAGGTLLFYLRGPTDLLTDAEWAPTGTTVVTAERDGVVRIYRCGVCGTLPQLQALASTRLAAAR
jgi:WD40 repeat protein